MNENRMKEEFLTSRKAAGRVIDVETCEIWWLHRNVVDPYGVDSDSDPEYCVGRVYFVRSAESDGPVCLYDLPDEKVRALRNRIDRETKRGVSHDVLDLWLPTDTRFERHCLTGRTE